MQRASQPRKGDNRAKGAHQRNRGNQHAVETNGPGFVQKCGKEQHRKIKQKDNGMGDRRVSGGHFFHLPLRFGKLCGFLIHLPQPFFALSELQRF